MLLFLRPFRLTLYILFAISLLITACGTDAVPTPTLKLGQSDNTADDGETIGVHYTGTLDDGSVFDSSEGRAPISFVLGKGQVIQGFEAAVRGMTIGETKTVRIAADKAYGQKREELIGTVARDGLPEDTKIGDQLRSDNGQVAVVLEIMDEVVRLDANHPLAGKALTFSLTLISID